MAQIPGVARSTAHIPACAGVLSMEMLNFLIVYDRPAGKLLRLEDFGTRGREALAERFRIDREEARDKSHVEVVVLRGESLAAVQRSHGRYWGRILP